MEHDVAVGRDADEHEAGAVGWRWSEPEQAEAWFQRCGPA